jgi:hypothetical protein
MKHWKEAFLVEKASAEKAESGRSLMVRAKDRRSAEVKLSENTMA